MEIVDAQLHADEAHPAELHIPMLDAAGVDAAVLVQTIRQGFDNSYLLAAAARHPDRFGVVGVLDASSPDIAHDVAAWRESPNAVGLRIVALTPEREEWLRTGYYDGLLDAAESERVPVFVYAPWSLGELDAIAGSHPELVLVLDHLGVPQPPVLAPWEDPWRDFDRVLGLARFPKVAVKCSGAPTLSTERYPFRDLWPRLHRVLYAFGPERVAWGSDITREEIGHTYAETVGYLRDTDELDDAEKELVLGMSLRRLVAWEAPAVTSGGTSVGA